MESPVPGKFAYIESLDSIRTQMPTAAHWIIGVRRPGVEEQADPLFTAILEHAEVAGARCGDVTAGIVRDKQAQFHQVGFSAKHGAIALSRIDPPVARLNDLLRLNGPSPSCRLYPQDDSSDVPIVGLNRP